MKIWEWIKAKFNQLESNISEGTIHFILFLIGLGSGVLLLTSANVIDEDQLKVLNKLFNVGVVIGVFFFIIRYLGGKETNVWEKILKSSIALAIILGLLVNAVALAVALS